MELFKNEDGQVIVVQDGETLQQVIEADYLERGEEAHITEGPNVEFREHGEITRTWELVPAGYKKISDKEEAFTILNGDQWCVMVCRYGRDVGVGFLTPTECEAYLMELTHMCRKAVFLFSDPNEICEVCGH